MHPIKTIKLHPVVRTKESRTAKPARVPFSFTGILAVLSAPGIFFFDLFSGSHACIGVLYILTLALLTNERRALVVIYATVAAVLLTIDMRLFYGQTARELFVMDKMVALFAIALIAPGIIYYRAKKVKSEKEKARRARKPFCVIKSFNETQERVATSSELKPVRQHLHKAGKERLDPFTRELMLFIYQKSVKN